MNKRKISRWKKGKGIKTVTHMPDFILHIKGKLDAKKLSLPEAHTEKLLKSLAAIENAETLVAENILTATRNSAIKAICAIEEAKTVSSDPISSSEPLTEAEIRVTRQQQARRNAVVANAKAAKEILPSLNEAIVTVHSILDERIEKTRKKAHKKLMAYVSGVRKGGKADFNVMFDANNDAREIYHKHHNYLDNLINRAVYSGFDLSVDDRESDV